MGWKAHNSTTIWSFSIFLFISIPQTEIFIFVLISILAFFSVAKASLQQNSILIQFFFLKYHEYKNASLVFSLSYLLSELFFSFSSMFCSIFISTIFLKQQFHFFSSTFLILIFFVHIFLFIRTFLLLSFNILCIVSLSAFNPDLYMYKYGIQYCIYVCVCVFYFISRCAYYNVVILYRFMFFGIFCFDFFKLISSTTKSSWNQLKIFFALTVFFFIIFGFISTNKCNALLSNVRWLFWLS